MPTRVRKASTMNTVDGETSASEIPTASLTLIVHTLSREDFKVDIGKVNGDQLAEINESISTAIARMTPSKQWSLTGTDGIAHHFNTEHIVCIEARLV